MAIRSLDGIKTYLSTGLHDILSRTGKVAGNIFIMSPLKLCGVFLSLCVATALGQGAPSSDPFAAGVPQPAVNPPVQGAVPVVPAVNNPLSQVTPIVNLPPAGQMINQATGFQNQPFGTPFGQPSQVAQPVWQQPPGVMQAPGNQQVMQTAGQQPATQQQTHQPVAVAPPAAGGPLASLAAANTLANALQPQQQQQGISPLGLLALGGGSDALFPMMMLSQTGMLQKNPMLSLYFMQNF